MPESHASDPSPSPPPACAADRSAGLLLGSWRRAGPSGSPARPRPERDRRRRERRRRRPRVRRPPRRRPRRADRPARRRHWPSSPWLDGPRRARSTSPGEPATPDALFVVEQVGRIRIVARRRSSSTARSSTSPTHRHGRRRARPAGPRLPPGLADGPRSSSTTRSSTATQVVASYATPARRPGRRRPRQRDGSCCRSTIRSATTTAAASRSGPDGFLYISHRRRRWRRRSARLGPRLDTLLAKVLRLDIDVADGAEPAYGIPDDNPFVADGRRAPRDLADRAAQSVAHPLRPGDRRPVDRRRRPGRVGGDRRRARRRRRPRLRLERHGGRALLPRRRRRLPTDGLTLPVTEYGHDQGCSVTGGTVVSRHRPARARRAGTCSRDYCSGRLWVIDPTLATRPRRRSSLLDSGSLDQRHRRGRGRTSCSRPTSGGELLRVVVEGALAAGGLSGSGSVTVTVTAISMDAGLDRRAHVAPPASSARP